MQRASTTPPPSGSSGGFLPKPDTFNGSFGKGSADVETWLFQVAHHLRAYNKPPAQWVGFASALLRGTAATWWRLKSHNGTAEISWDAFTAMMVADFKPVNSVQRAKDRIATLRQKRSATEYCNEFRLAVLDIPDMNESWMLDAFFRGLKPNVQRELERYPPPDLHEAMRQAERIDAIDYKYSSSSRNHNSHSRRGHDGPWRSSTAQSSGPVPMELGALQIQQRLSDAERDKLRKENRCFFCREQGHTKFFCPKKKQQGRPENGRSR